MSGEEGLPKPAPTGLRRLLAGLNVTAAAALAIVLFAMVNYVAARFPARWDVSRTRFYTLSEKTRSILANIHTDVDLYAVYGPRHESFEHVRHLLDQYAYEARHVPSTLNLRVHYVDPDRDLAMMKELRQRSGLVERNVILCRSGARSKLVTDQDLYAIVPGTSTPAAFRGEMALSSALQNVVQQHQPVVYFLLGHGERDFRNFDNAAGYSRIGRVIERDNIALKPIVLTDALGVPEDADALLIAGPTRRLAHSEVDTIGRYLEESGRVYALLDPFIVTGLEELLQNWGIKLANDYVVDAASFNMGRDFFVASFGAHEITRKLRNIAVGMSMPRSIEAVPQAAAAGTGSDRPRVTVLATTSPESWAELDLSARRAAFTKGIDRWGPIGLGAAVEKGVSSVQLGLMPTRLVVVGDSDLVANQTLQTGLGGNPDFFMAGLNWLVDREELMAVAAKPMDGFQLRLEPEKMKWMTAVLTLGLPGTVALLGLLIWMARRRS